MTRTTNAQLFERAQLAIPGGVDSPVRAFRAVGGTPYFVERGQGPYVWDVEGHRYIDLVQSYGAIIAGHAHPAVVEAVQRAARDGTSYGAPTAREVVLAEAIRERMPSMQKVRLVSSGTEATMSAIRVARGFTGRDRVVKFAGCYHGHSDALLAEAGSSVAQLDPEAVARSGSVPGSAGVPSGAVSATTVAPYNVVPALDDTVACVIVEPVAANMGLVPPNAGFLDGLRDECDRVGALLIFDEVITGFRVAPGGVQEALGVTPDLTTVGKVIGGGLPVGAFGGRADVMDALAPVGPVYQAGTLSGNPLATAAGLAVLEMLDGPAYLLLEERASLLVEAFTEAFQTAGLPACVPSYRSLFGLYFGDESPRDYGEAKRTDERRYSQFFHALLARGVAIAPGAYEVCFPGLAHDDNVIDEIASAVREAAAEVTSR